MTGYSVPRMVLNCAPVVACESFACSRHLSEILVWNSNSDDTARRAAPLPAMVLRLYTFFILNKNSFIYFTQANVQCLFVQWAVENLINNQS